MIDGGNSMIDQKLEQLPSKALFTMMACLGKNYSNPIPHHTMVDNCVGSHALDYSEMT